ncbi:hypothetical protein MRS76_15485 [Rhizobiaceae bacterium n13]|uniref:hypothetical protein n=1 Tax=Ferirhizobium litorale TaxID=2927786 RepID=UPI0024B291FA|nr:hypothetical protein [Fererhizobium litorale]MDI7863357.1 hypothetical protein [Fererhizobium litorale]
MILSALLLGYAPDRGGAASVKQVTATIPAPLIGPYIVDPVTLAELDHYDRNCARAGSLNFQCLVFKDDRSMMKEKDFASNPFQLSVFEKVQETVESDLKSLPKHIEFGGSNAKSLDIGFLTYPGAHRAGRRHQPHGPAVQPRQGRWP